ncbi:phage shock protein C (PspC) family protein [Brevibacterium sanguinis]|uniref:Phage shock protein C (PspC) family protein n=2 Tax=Brevibacterium TaxID=1696 RepID=A0A366IK41_9MICO|nr:MULTISPECIES: PspC domain-containing protein [Brevibacterium]RBP65661.1 phage shock protein C (PspC) family protein [Brevibacterium sanguinis]RBP72295.1 phage shock protein C (PspC) family protein [Brevibacterium celere]
MNSIFNAIRKSGYRRGPQRLVGGIAGGLAKSLGMNVWLVRLLTLVASLLPVIGIGAYLIAWVLTPWQDGSIPLERSLGRGSIGR